MSAVLAKLTIQWTGQMIVEAFFDDSISRRALQGHIPQDDA